MPDELIEIEFNGRSLHAAPTQTLLAALWDATPPTLHVTAHTSEPRSAFCGIGLCFDCVALVNGTPNVRTCMTVVEPGMVVETQTDPGQ